MHRMYGVLCKCTDGTPQEKLLKSESRLPKGPVRGIGQDVESSRTIGCFRDANQDTGEGVKLWNSSKNPGTLGSTVHMRATPLVQACTYIRTSSDVPAPKDDHAMLVPDLPFDGGAQVQKSDGVFLRSKEVAQHGLSDDSQHAHQSHSCSCTVQQGLRQMAPQLAA